MISAFFADTVNEGSANLYDAFRHLSKPVRLSQNYVGVTPVQHAPHSMTNVVHSRLRSHRRRRFLSVHQLGEDDRNLAESLDDNGQHGCEEDIKQQRIARILAVVLAQPQTNPNRLRHQVAYKLSYHRGNVG